MRDKRFWITAVFLVGLLGACRNPEEWNGKDSYKEYQASLRHDIKCYSNGTLIFDEVVAGSVWENENGFTTRTPGPSVTGDCVIRRVD